MATECKAILSTHFQIYLYRAPSNLLLSTFHQDAQNQNVEELYSIRLATEHTASISAEEGAQKSILVKAGKHRSPYFILQYLPPRKGLKVATQLVAS